MKKDYKMYGFATAAIMFVLGIYLLGHAGANYLQSNSGAVAEDTGALLSLSVTATIQFILGLVVAILGVFVYLIFLRKRPEEEEF